MGTEEFWIPAVMAAVSTGAEAVNQQQANSRQQNSEAQSIMDQQQYRNQATAEVNKQIQNIKQSNPTALQDQATSAYVSQLRKNAAGAQSGTNNASQTFGQSTSALAPSVNGNARYNKDVASSQQETQQYGTNEAQEMGAIDAAVRQRQNEGLAAQTLGSNLDVLGAESYGTSFVDQLRAQAAGQTNPWVSLGSSILSQAASGASKNMTGAPSGTTSYGQVGTNGNSKAGTPLWAGNGLTTSTGAHT